MSRTNFWQGNLLGVALMAGLISRSGVSQTPLEKIEKLTGEAHLLESDKLLYREENETHFLGGTLRSIHTRYVAADGKLLAELDSRFAQNPYLPESHFIDHRDQYTYSIYVSEDGKTVTVEQQDGPKKPVEKKSFPMKPNLMTLQGALLSLHENWPKLASGEEVHIRYIVPSRLDEYGVVIKLQKSAPKGELQLLLEMESRMIRLFAPSMNLRYSTSNQRLLEFSGASNLLDEAGKIQKVRITYK